MGRVQVSKYQLGNHEQVEWEVTKSNYDEIKDMLLIPAETDIKNYLTLSNCDRYAVLVAVREEASANSNPTIINKIKSLGFRCGHKKSDKIIEQVLFNLLSEEGALRNGRRTFSIAFVGNASGNISIIEIKGVRFKFVVYGNIYEKDD